jgi:hypothetical protein
MDRNLHTILSSVSLMLLLQTYPVERSDWAAYSSKCSSIHLYRHVAHAAWESFQNERIIINQDTLHVTYERIVFKGRIFVHLCLSTKPWKRTTLAIAASSLLHSLTALPQNKLSPVTWIRPVTVLGTDPYKSGLIFYLQKPLKFLRQRSVSLKWQYSGSYTVLKLW